MKAKIVIVWYIGIVASAWAWSQNSMELSWVQVSVTQDGERSHVIYGGSQFPYRATSGIPTDDCCHSLYWAEWSEQFMNGLRGTRFYSSDGRILEFKLSPSNVYIALTESLGQAQTSDVRLSIINLSGEVLHSIDLVRKFAWSPSGDKIAFIVGTSYEGGLGFHSTGTFVLDMETERIRKLTEGGWDIQWEAWGDKSIYIWDLTNEGPLVLKYRTDSRSLEETSLRGIHFSPNGQFYFNPSAEGAPFGLFKTENDEELTTDDRGIPNDYQKTSSNNVLSFLQSRQMRYAQPRGWLDENILVIPDYASREYVREYLYDVQHDTCLLVSGVVIGTDRQGILVLNPATKTIDARKIRNFGECAPD